MVFAAVNIPLLQLYEAPPLAVIVEEEDKQFSVEDAGVILAAGGVIFWLTTDDAVAVHPFVPVTVTL